MLAQPTRRVVLLGASNLTLAFPIVMACLRRRWSEPLEILVAHGHGRSYGASSRVFARTLPGIAECGLWPRLESERELPTFACLSDIGNDIMYGHDVAKIAGWIERDLDRLTSAGAEVVLVHLPLATIRELGRARFDAARWLLFSGRRITLESVRDRACALDERLHAMARARGARSVVPSAEWYSYDPIHVCRGKRAVAWSAVVGDTAEGAPSLDPRDRRRLVALRHERRHLFGFEERRDQPSVRLADGTTVSAY